MGPQPGPQRHSGTDSGGGDGDGGYGGGAGQGGNSTAGCSTRRPGPEANGDGGSGGNAGSNGDKGKDGVDSGGDGRRMGAKRQTKRLQTPPRLQQRQRRARSLSPGYANNDADDAEAETGERRVQEDGAVDDSSGR
jgi:hypothetical protein